MNRCITNPRLDWREKVEAIGLTYHSHEHGPYWCEDVFYRFTARQIDQIEEATNRLHEMIIEAAGHVIDNNRFKELGIPDTAIPAIYSSWERDDFSLYGRFDFAYNGDAAPKLLEYNADTPTALVEAAVAQWNWKEDVFPTYDQFNSIHEKLIETWKKLPITIIHFSSVIDNLEDEQTISYLMDTAMQAGLHAEWIDVAEIGYHHERKDFFDVNLNREIRALFKLYPWEWMFREEFGAYIKNSKVQFIEPAWKALLSNKGILPILWELFPNSPYLLPTFRTPDKLGKTYVKKPILSREGANVSYVNNGVPLIQRDGPYGDEGFIYQQVAPIPNFDGYYPIIGSWVVDHTACGIGIREDKSLITGNLSRFVPHLFS